VGDPSSAVLLWGSGKDCSYALWVLRRRGIRVGALLTGITDGLGRTPAGARRSVMRRQAESIGLPLIEVGTPRGCDRATFVGHLGTALADPSLSEHGSIAAGNLMGPSDPIARLVCDGLEAATGKQMLMPFSGMAPQEYARSLVASGFRAVLTAVDTDVVDESFLGREYDAALLDDLPVGVDPGLEHPSFQTFAFDGPVYRHPVAFRLGKVARFAGVAHRDVQAA